MADERALSMHSRTSAYLRITPRAAPGAMFKTKFGNQLMV